MTIVINTFTQADGNLGSPWVGLAGATIPHVTSNQVDAPTAGVLYGATNPTGLTFTTFGLIQLEFTHTAGDVLVGWADPATINGYYAGWNSTSGGMRISRVTGGVATTVVNGTVPSGGFHTIRYEKAGSAHRLYLDGVLDCSGTDATYATNANVLLVVNETSGATTADTLIYSNEPYRRPTPTVVRQAVQRAAVR